IERIDVAVVAADEDAPGRNSRLSVRCIALRKSECPFQLQLGNLFGAESGCLAVLETRVLAIRAPSVPRSAGRRVCERRIPCAPIGHLLRAACFRQIEWPAA